MDPADHQPAASRERRFFDRLLDQSDPAAVLHFLRRLRTRWVLSWLLFLSAAAFVAEEGWTSYNDAERRDGNGGHCTIDFGGQWLMGRMVVEGKARHLYDRRYLRPVAEANYPAGVGRSEGKSDTEALMDWLAGTDDGDAPEVVASLLAPLAAGNALEEAAALAGAESTWTEERLAHVTTPPIGGGLYPPVHALYFAPLALLPPPIGYRVIQSIIFALVFVAGWVAHRMTEGRVWWPIASLFVMMVPGYSGCIALGQNGMFTLFVVLVGWWQLMRGREVLAGLCWGLLAFKPVWAAAFYLVPLLTGRRRMAVSMALAGLAQIALTLPLVGWQVWWHWLQVGQEASQEYRRQQNWIFLSRDLLGLPRRWLLTFEDSVARNLIWQTGPPPTEGGAVQNPWDHPLLSILGWGPWILVFGLTVFVVWRRWQRRRELTGEFPAFVLSAAILTCYHYMYYDFVVAGLPMLLLFTDPHRYFQAHFWHRPRWLSRLFADHTANPMGLEDPAFPTEMRRYYQPSVEDWPPPPMPLLPDGRRPRWVAAPMPPLLLTLMLALPALACLLDPSFRFPPWDTFVLLAVWAWCGYRLLRKPVTDAAPKAWSEKTFVEEPLTPEGSTL